MVLEKTGVLWLARSNQSILKEINPEYSLEGLILKLKLQYFDHLMLRADSQEKTLMLVKTEGTSLCQETRSPEREITILEGVLSPILRRK